MDATTRRNTILKSLGATPQSATALAKALGVSRQVIVGDIALLRAQGQDIIATARGYIVPNFAQDNLYIGKVACCHDASATKAELYTMVDLGATVINVMVEHEIYGEIAGQLNIKTREDVEDFIERVKPDHVKLLSDLKAGVHIHTIACRDSGHFAQVQGALEQGGFLFENKC